MTHERTLDNGSTIRLEDSGHDRLVILDYPDAAAEMRNREAGRIINGGFQQAPYSSAFALRPATLRALADLIEAAPAADLAGLVREAIDAHHIAASFFTGDDLEALTCVCTDEHGSGDFTAYEAFLAHQAEAVAAHLQAGVSGVAR